MNVSTRFPVAAGRFYPGSAEALAAQISAMTPHRDIDSSVKAVFVPHAGYVFSGRVAGTVFGRIQLAETVVVLAPNHTGKGKSLAVWASGEWQTPLGPALVDYKLAAALLASDTGFEQDTKAHLTDHAIEVVLPFIQHFSPASRIVPICVALHDFSGLERAGQALAEAIGPGDGSVSLVVSTDMSHYVPHELAASNDRLALESMARLDGAALARCVRANNISMCGVAPAIMALAACRAMGASTAEVAAYATSGETGAAYGATRDRVVGYAGVLIR